MMWYYAAEGKQAGPVSQEELIALVRSGQINLDSLIWREGMANWQPLRELQSSLPGLHAPADPGPFPAGSGEPAAEGVPPSGQICSECGKLFPPEQMIRYADRYVCATCKPIFVQRMTEGAPQTMGTVGMVSAEQVLAREYRVDIGLCLQRAWKLFTDNAGMAIVAPILVGAVFLAGYAATMVLNLIIPFVGGFLTLLYSAPLGAGLLYYFVRMARGESPAIGDLFVGFRRNYFQLVLGGLVQMVFSGICFIPAIISGVFMGVSFAVKSGRPVTNFGNAGLFGVLGFTVLLGIIGVVYLSTIWTFSTFLMIDKNMGFWAAMQLSRKMVSKSWWWTLLFLIVSGLIYVAGALVCGVGMLVSAPLFVAMKSYLYDDNFRDLAPQTS
ncbi:MAG TPA: GYF domain-containing protein [Candidatus Saccharimonadales bacterium]|nr:GYF domain-containing protein [Candidatus Saccharimonadales bacterium]